MITMVTLILTPLVSMMKSMMMIIMSVFTVNLLLISRNSGFPEES